MITQDGRNYTHGKLESSFRKKAMPTSILTTDQLRFAAIEARLAEIEASLREGSHLTVAPKPSIENDVLYNVQEVAQALRCGKTNVYDLIESGQLAVTKIGNSKKGMRVRGADLITFLDARKEGGPAPSTKYRFLKKLG
jgi:excisionase family DNA binding protein